MSEAILLHLDNQWSLCDRDTVQAVQEFPALSAPTMVLTDFGGALSGISPVGGRSDYAEALIGRRLRDEGLIDGEARVIVHQCFKDGGGVQAFYTAIPINAWQQMQSFAQRQKEDCLLIPQAAVMARLAQDGGVIFRNGRRFSLFFQGKESQGYFSALSLSDQREDLESALQTLARRLKDQSPDPSRIAEKWTWLSLSGSSDPGEDARLCAVFSQASGIAASCAPARRYRASDGHQFLALDALRPVLSERIAINSLQTRFNYFAEKRLMQAGWCAGAAALAFVFAGGFSLWQAGEIDAAAQERRERAHAMTRQAVGSASVKPPAPGFYETHELIDLIAGAQSGIDPYAFLKNLRDASGDKVKLLRVFVGKEIVIEGWVDQTGGDDRPLAGFVTRLRQMGFSLDAIDTSSNTNARRSGFFAYRLQKDSAQGEGL